MKGTDGTNKEQKMMIFQEQNTALSTNKNIQTECYTRSEPRCCCWTCVQ